MQVFPSRKTEHFRRIQDASGVDYADMIFFDNEFRNIADVSTLGVCCHYVPDGMTLEAWAEGLDVFQRGKAAGAHEDHSKSTARRRWY